jgi:excisionase family DNA binding protein
VSSALVVIPADQLAAIIEFAVSKALDAREAASTPPKAQHDHLTIAEAADLLRCSQATVRRRIRQRKLTTSKVGQGGARVLVTLESVQKLLATR